jgi:hypothetical protein
MNKESRRLLFLDLLKMAIGFMIGFMAGGFMLFIK